MTDDEKRELAEAIAIALHARTCHWPGCQLAYAGENMRAAEIAVDVIERRAGIQP